MSLNLKPTIIVNDIKHVIGIILLFLFMKSSYAQHLNDELNIPFKTSKEVMDDFMDQRFGMFIHWGPVTLRGTEIGWSRTRDVPAQEYDRLYEEFDPSLFDADQWVKTAKDAGMKYLTITAKHHDGFCLWPTAYSNYNIMNSPFKVDIVGELARACREQGIKFCIYFTVLDWHDPHYPIHSPDKQDEDPKANMRLFVNTMKNQLKELVTNYDPYMLWFDGNWEKPWKRAYAVEIYNFLKKLKPDVIVNNRVGADHDHQLLTDQSIGDYATPEQKIGEFRLDFPWETCMTICNQWAWKPNDPMKSLEQCVQTLVRTAGGNGNLLFNVGPMLDGRIEKRQIDRLREMGQWLKKNEESIYGTRGGPLKPTDDYVTTRKGNKIYVHVLNNTLNDLPLPIAKDKNKIKSVYILGGGKVDFQQAYNEGVKLKIPTNTKNTLCPVIVIEMENPINI